MIYETNVFLEHHMKKFMKLSFTFFKLELLQIGQFEWMKLEQT